MKSREYLFKIGLNLLTGVFIVGSIGLIFYWYQHSETNIDVDQLESPGKYRAVTRKIGRGPDAIRIKTIAPIRPLEIDYYNDYFINKFKQNN